MNSSERLSAGLKALPDKISSFAGTQAAWRFYQNESVSLSKLQKPLTAAAHDGIAEHSGAITEEQISVQVDGKTYWQRVAEADVTLRNEHETI